MKCAAPRKERTIDPEDKAQRVLASARTLFVQRGYHRVSVPDIVRDSGVSTGAIYNLFGNKENLARVLHQNTLEAFLAGFQERLIGRETTYEKLRAFAELVFDLTESDPELMEYLLFMRHAEFMEDVPPVCLTEPFKLVRQIVGEGMVRGELRKRDVFISAVTYTGAILRPAQLRIECVLTRPMGEMAEEFIENAWTAIKA